MAEIPFDVDVTDANNTGRFPENMTFAAVNNAARALEGMLARWSKDGDCSITSSGSANAYTLTTRRTIAALTNNTVIAWTANFSNTGAATLAMNGLTAKAIKRPNGDALAANDIVSGQPVITIYKSATETWVLLSPPGALATTADVAAQITAGIAATRLRRAYAEYTTYTSFSDVIPADNTIPQNTEGTEILTVSITPQSATNRVRIRFRAMMRVVNQQYGIAALFKDSTANALTAVAQEGDDINPFILEFEDAPGGTSEVTYKIRVGPQSGATLYINGNSSERKFGGVARATLIAEEVYAT